MKSYECALMGSHLRRVRPETTLFSEKDSTSLRLQTLWWRKWLRLRRTLPVSRYQFFYHCRGTCRQEAVQALHVFSIYVSVV